MKITYNEFEILVYLEKEKGSKTSQRILAKKLNLSLGTINKTINNLIDYGFIDNSNNLSITKKGLLTLEPYKVKKAIFLAAGFGSRLVPITLNTPKPLVKVHGKRMIETLLDAVSSVGIKEIYIVRGYLGEQFEVLKNKYPNIKFLDNLEYNEANNISSALMAKDFFSNAYVLESDLILYNTDLIRKYEYHSNFLGKYVSRTDDWCLYTKKGVIIEETIGGENCYQMYGISYFDEKDGKKLKNDIEEVYNMPGGKEKYWDQVPLVYKKNNYQVFVRPCQEGDIIEIDTFNELKSVDKTYDC